MDQVDFSSLLYERRSNKIAKCYAQILNEKKNEQQTTRWVKHYDLNFFFTHNHSFILYKVMWSVIMCFKENYSGNRGNKLQQRKIQPHFIYTCSMYLYHLYIIWNISKLWMIPRSSPWTCFQRGHSLFMLYTR